MGRFLLLVSCLVASIGAQSDAPAGSRRALLIGIDQYRSDSIPPLRGCRNDVLILGHLLRTRFAFDQIETLVNASATRAAILAALDRAVTAAGPGDTLFIHFSGHGSQQRDANGDERDDGLDETLVAHDSRSGDVPDILDDEIEARLSRLAARDVVVSIDACHSGTGTRELTTLRARDVPPDPRHELYRNLGPATRQRGGGAWVAISSALPQERALDGPVDGVPHGLFTRALVETLADQPTHGSQASAAETIRRVAIAYDAIVNRLGVDHRASTPNAEIVGVTAADGGANARWDRPIFPPPPPGRAARRPWIEVTAGANASELVLRDAVPLGAALGAAYAVHAADDTEFAPGAALALCEVVGHDGAHARLAIHSRRDESALVGARAVRVGRAAMGDAPRVRIDLSADDRAAVATLLAKLAPRALVLAPGTESAFDFVVTRSVEGDDVEIRAGDGRTPVDRRKEPTDAARVVARTLMAGTLLSLHNPTSALELRAWTAHAGDAVDSREVGVVRVGRPQRRSRPSGGGPRVWRDGDPFDESNTLLLHVQAEQDCWVTVVNVDGRGNVSLLFPNALSEESGFLPEGRVTAGSEVRIPDGLGEGSTAGFVMPLLTAGKETIQVFATSDADTASRIREAITRAHRLQKADPEASAEVGEILEALRTELLASVTTAREVGVMGVEVVSNRPRRRPAGALGDWTTTALSFRVGEHEGGR